MSPEAEFCAPLAPVDADVPLTDEANSDEPTDLTNNGTYFGVVTKIGRQPYLDIDGVGEVRFAYRNVKKQPGEAKPFVRVGEMVTCRLAQTSPLKAVSVRLVKRRRAETPPLSVEGSVSSCELESPGALSTPGAPAFESKSSASQDDSAALTLCSLFSECAVRVPPEPVPIARPANIAPMAYFDPFSAPALTITPALLC